MKKNKTLIYVAIGGALLFLAYRAFGSGTLGPRKRGSVIVEDDSLESISQEEYEKAPTYEATEGAGTMPPQTVTNKGESMEMPEDQVSTTSEYAEVIKSLRRTPEQMAEARKRREEARKRREAARLKRQAKRKAKVRKPRRKKKVSGFENISVC